MQRTHRGAVSLAGSQSLAAGSQGGEGGTAHPRSQLIAEELELVVDAQALPASGRGSLGVSTAGP